MIAATGRVLCAGEGIAQQHVQAVPF